MLEEEAKKLVRMEDELRKRVVGQDTALEKISSAVKRSRVGISEPDRPIGSFMFLGPTGVGKTELAKALAGFMFNDDQALVRVDMSEYMERHSISRMLGAPPGYVGHEEAGSLTETVRHRPYSVLLFDEIEKAHPEVFNVLLQVLDDGRLTDAKGRTVNFKNTVIIMTSNVGAEFIDRMGTIGFVSGEDKEEVKYENAKDKARESLKDRFRPEFLNRLDEIIMFDVLSHEAIERIVEIQIEIVIKRLSEKEITLKVSNNAIKHLAEEGYNPSYGARPLKRLIQDKIMTPIAQMMVSRGIMSGGAVSVDVRDQKFIFDVRKGRARKTKKVVKAEKEKKKKVIA